MVLWSPGKPQVKVEPENWARVSYRGGSGGLSHGNEMGCSSWESRWTRHCTSLEADHWLKFGLPSTDVRDHCSKVLQGDLQGWSLLQSSSGVTLQGPFPWPLPFLPSPACLNQCRVTLSQELLAGLWWKKGTVYNGKWSLVYYSCFNLGLVMMFICSEISNLNKVILYLSEGT